MIIMIVGTLFACKSVIISYDIAHHSVQVPTKVKGFYLPLYLRYDY